MSYSPVQGRAIILFAKGLAAVPPFPVAGDGIKFNAITDKWELAPFGGGGEVNTSSNVGIGAGLALAKVGVDLPFKSLLGNPEIVLTPTPTTVDFSIGAIAQSKITGLVAALLTKIDTVLNVGTGDGDVFRNISPSTTLNLKTILEGDGIDVINNADDIEIKNLIVGIVCVNNDRDVPGSSTEFFGISNQVAGDSSEVDVQNPMPRAMKFRNMTIHLVSNTRDGISTENLRINGVNGNLNLSIPASTAGTFIDTSNTDSVAQLDLINYFFSEGGSSGTIEIGGHGIETVHADA